MKKYSQAEINKHLNEAEKIALKIVEQKARKILSEHPNLDEFIMSMGLWCFTVKGEDNEITTGNCLNTHTRINQSQSFKYIESLENLFMKYDEYLKLTGNPMRFTAKGKIVRDW